MDFILELLSSEKNIESLKFSNYKNIENEFIKEEKYYLFSNKAIFENAIEFNKNISKQYSFNKFEQLLYSKTIINTYIEVLNDLYDKSLSDKEVASAIKNFKKNHNIFFVGLGLRYYGFILFDGTILINKKYYYQNKKDDIMVFIIFSTIFHEYIHVLSRIFRDDDNFFCNTDEFLKNKLINPKESGDYFDNKILFEVLPDKKLTLIEAEYLIDPINYKCKSSQEFKKAFLKFRKSHFQKIQNSPAQGISKENSGYNSINIVCGFQRGRINKK